MKRTLALLCVFGLVGSVQAQEKEKTTVTTKTTTVTTSEANLTSELWNIDDATTVPVGQIDLRFTGRWITSSFPANGSDEADDYVATPSLVFGLVENLEGFIYIPTWIGDSCEIPPGREGNYDTYLGMTWRAIEQDGDWPALGFKITGRAPTGDGSDGVDGELRLLVTNSYASDLRSHINAWGTTVNTTNDENLRDFQYGFSVGMDGPLCGDGAVRWVADYMNRSSHHNGSANMNILEAGWEWQIEDMHKLGMSFNVGLDDNDDTPNAGAALTYAYSITK
jgi:hypothetical protein